MGALQGRVDGVAVLGSVVVAERAARLHAGGSDAVDHEAMLDHVVGLGAGGIGRRLVAEQLHEADIVGAAVPHRRRAFGGGLRGRRNGGQRFVIDDDMLGGVERLMVGFCDDEGDGIADEAHPVDRKRGIGRAKDAAVAALQSAGDGQIAPAGGLPIRAGEYGQHAERRLRLARIDRTDARMGVRRAQHVAERHPGQHHVTDVAAAATQQARILEAGHALADCEFTHVVPRDWYTAGSSGLIACGVSVATVPWVHAREPAMS